MKAKGTQGRWFGPIRVVGQLAAAVALTAMALAVLPAGPRRAGLWTPAVPGGPATAPALVPGTRFWPLPTTPTSDPRPADRCLVPAPAVDGRFVVPPPETNDEGPFVVRPMVQGLPAGAPAP